MDQVQTIHQGVRWREQHELVRCTSWYTLRHLDSDGLRHKMGRGTVSAGFLTVSAVTSCETRARIIMLRAWRHWQAAQRETHALLTFWDRRQLAGWRAGLPVLRLATRKDGLSHLVSLARLKREYQCGNQNVQDTFNMVQFERIWRERTPRPRDLEQR